MSENLKRFLVTKFKYEYFLFTDTERDKCFPLSLVNSITLSLGLNPLYFEFYVFLFSFQYQVFNA